MDFPFFVKPDEHRLGAYYRKLNWWGFAIAPAILVFNELIFRQYLPVYRATPDKLMSFFVLALNAQVPISSGNFLYGFCFLLALLFATTFSFLPQWGTRPVARGLKKGLPSYAEYSVVFFYIENRFQKIAFYVWHWVLMRTTLILGVCSICMAINLFRGIS